MLNDNHSASAGHKLGIAGRALAKAEPSQKMAMSYSVDIFWTGDIR